MTENDNRNGTEPEFEQDRKITPPEEQTPPRVWNVPPQDGGEYHPPIESEPPIPPQPPVSPQPPVTPPQQPSRPPQQYSTSGGWQQRDNRGTRPEQPYQWNVSDYEQAQAQAVKPRKKNKGLLVFGVLVCAVLAIAGISLTSIALYNHFSGASSSNAQNGDSPTINVPAADLPGITIQEKPQDSGVALPDGKLTSEQIIEKVTPSVVAITTYINFQNYQAEGMGSGIVLSPDGFLVTNAHVVEGALGITVQLHDGTQYEGRLIGSDSKTDLAVVKIDATGLTPADFGDSTQTKMGEKVLAIGNPQSMDFVGSVTQGIVSGLNREISAGGQNGTSITHYTNLIQTDAAINPGNSGGALVNEYGQVIGINSAKVVSSGAEGMGFAIPSDQVKPIVDDLMTYGRVTGRVRLGIYATEVDEVLARLNHVPTGLFVQSTESGSDISKKGIVPGDIITKVNGKDITGTQDLAKEIDGKKPGDTVELEVYRPSSRPNSEGRFFNVKIELMEDSGDSTPAPQKEQIPAPNQNPAPQNPNGNRVPNTLDEFFSEFFG